MRYTTPHSRHFLWYPTRIVACALFFNCVLYLAPLPAHAANPGDVTLAAQAKEKIEFIAQVAPRLALAGLDKEDNRNAAESSSRQAARLLWVLRDTPESYAIEMGKLLNGTQKPYTRLRELENTVNTINGATRILYEQIENKKLPPLYVTRETDAAKTFEAEAAIEKATNLYRRFVAQNYPAIAGIRPAFYANKTLLPILWNLRNKKGDLKLATAIYSDKTIPNVTKEALVARIDRDPDGVRKDFARLPHVIELQKRYTSMLRQTRRPYITGLPIAALGDDIAAAIEKPGIMPLAANPVTRPDSSISIRTLPELLSADATTSLQKTISSELQTLPVLPFLKHGENLYVLLNTKAEDAIPIFSGTPLSDVADLGPYLQPYTLKTATSILERYILRDKRQRQRMPLVLLVASAAPITEVAAHLASLAVMKGEPESTLYPPYNVESKRASSIDIADVPGVASRLMSLDTGLFPILLPLADKAGTARLMGPLTAVWQSAHMTEISGWLEIRSTKAQKTAILGKTPILELSQTVREKAVTYLREYYLGGMRFQIVRDMCEDKNLPLASPECQKLEAKLIGDLQKTIPEMISAGFTSPLDLSIASFLLVRFQDNKVLADELRSILKDASKSAKERIEQSTPKARDALRTWRQQKNAAELEELNKPRQNNGTK